MHRLIAAILIFTGCTSEPHEQVDHNPGDEVDVSTSPPSKQQEEIQYSTGPSECGSFAGRLEVVTVDDVEIALPIFVACNPRYVDLGYPLPLGEP